MLINWIWSLSIIFLHLSRMLGGVVEFVTMSEQITLASALSVINVLPDAQKKCALTIEDTVLKVIDSCHCPLNCTAIIKYHTHTSYSIPQ